MTSLKQHIGKNAESLALEFLKTKGFSLIKRNYFCYLGEIDLIMQDQKDIVFVEVRYRHNSFYGKALETITTHKIKKIIKTATHFLQMQNWLYTRHSRFDIIAIDVIENKPNIDWIKHAFDLDSCT